MKLVRPIVVVMGSTGTGKTKLAAELCLHFSGEVISTDSMQVYQGLDIGTNKATPEEMKGIPHHMIGMIPPLTIGYNVIDFRDKAISVIEDIWRRNKLPVLVGGTTYYTEAVLYNVLLDKFSGETKESEKETTTQEVNEPVPDYLRIPEELRSLKLYQRLEEVDPEMSQHVHPKNRRQILTSLQYNRFTGEKRSEAILEQTHSGSQYGGNLRFKNVCMLWLHCDNKVLDERLDKRVDEMVSLGLKEEVINFHDKYYADFMGIMSKRKDSIDEKDKLNKGIFQSIAFKEFLPFLSLSEAERKSESGEKLFQDGKDQLKLITRQYARKQNSWVRNRLLRPIDREVPPVYKLDTTNKLEWEQTVKNTALEIVEAFLNQESCSISPVCLEDEKKRTSDNPTTRRGVNYCHSCQIYTQGKEQWEIHMKSRRHKNQLIHLKNQALYEEKKLHYQELRQNLAQRQQQLNEEIHAKGLNVTDTSEDMKCLFDSLGCDMNK